MTKEPPETLDLSYDKTALPRLALEWLHNETSVGVVLWPWGREGACATDRIVVLRPWLVNGSRNNEPGYWTAEFIWVGAVLVSKHSTLEFIRAMEFAMRIAPELERHAFERGD